MLPPVLHFTKDAEECRPPAFESISDIVVLIRCEGQPGQQEQIRFGLQLLRTEKRKMELPHSLKSGSPYIPGL